MIIFLRGIKETLSMAQYCQEAVAESDCSEDMNKWKSPITKSGGKDNNLPGGFDCNICLDIVQDPVVTFCGHLYCWPCIYKWMNSQRICFDNNSDQQPECPVCKAKVSEKTLIPLYGRGQPTDSNRGTKLDVVVPRRPNGPGCGVHAVVTATTSRSSSQHPGQQLDYRHQLHPYNSQSPAAFRLAGTTTYNPMIEMFGEMIDTQISGNPLYAYPNTYSVVTTSSARGRLHIIKVDRSMSRVFFFLCCCVILCLLLF